MSGKREASEKSRKSKGKTKVILAVLILAVVVAAIIVAALARSGGSADQKETSDSQAASSSDSDTSENSADQTEESSADDSKGETQAEEEAKAGTQSSSALPQVEQSAGLTLSSVYTSSILNPDCGGEYAEEIASLEVTNSSGNYLVSATLTATMSDGTEIFFRVYDLPAGATAEIFDTENHTLDSSVTCTSLVCTSEEYIEEDVLLSDTVEILASGSNAVITNTGSSALTNLTVVYHCDMAGQFFGGASYTISIDNLAAGESFTLSDSALMGEVAVVRIYQ